LDCSPPTLRVAVGNQSRASRVKRGELNDHVAATATVLWIVAAAAAAAVATAATALSSVRAEDVSAGTRDLETRHGGPCATMVLQLERHRTKQQTSRETPPNWTPTNLWNPASRWNLAPPAMEAQRSWEPSVTAKGATTVMAGWRQEIAHWADASRASSAQEWQRLSWDCWGSPVEVPAKPQKAWGRPSRMDSASAHSGCRLPRVSQSGPSPAACASSAEMWQSGLLATWRHGCAEAPATLAIGQVRPSDGRFFCKCVS